MFDIIAVATVPHTATRSIVTLIDEHGYRKLQEILTFTKKERRSRNREKLFSASTKIHNHVYIQELGIEYQKTKDSNKCSLIDKNKINVIHGHIEPNTIECIKDISKLTELIVPCRDPLLTLLTAKVRNDKKPLPAENDFDKYKDLPTRLAQQLVAWELWAKEILPLNHINLPVDLDPPTLKYKGINFSKLPVIGSYGNYPLKQAYYDKDLDYIKFELGIAYDYFIDLKDVLQPPLENIGYADLLWW